MKEKSDIPIIKIPNYILKERKTYPTHRNSMLIFTFHHRYLRSLKTIDVAIEQFEERDSVITTIGTYSFLYRKKTENEILKNIIHQIKNDPQKRLSYLLGSRKIRCLHFETIEDWRYFFSQYMMFLLPILVSLIGFSIHFILGSSVYKYQFLPSLFAGFILGGMGSAFMSMMFLISHEFIPKKERFRSYKVTCVFALIFTIVFIFYR